MMHRVRKGALPVILPSGLISRFLKLISEKNGSVEHDYISVDPSSNLNISSFPAFDRMPLLNTTNLERNQICIECVLFVLLGMNLLLQDNAATGILQMARIERVQRATWRYRIVYITRLRQC